MALKGLYLYLHPKDCILKSLYIEDGWSQDQYSKEEITATVMVVKI